jgi:transmembrane sensor
MASARDPMERLGRRIGDDLGSGTSAERLQRHERALTALVAGGVPSARRVTPARVGVAAAILMAASLTVWLGWPSGGPMSYALGAERFRGGSDAWLEVPQEVGGSLTFDGGSEVELAGGTAARVVTAQRDRVDIELASGRVRANIEGNGSTRWAIDVGAYRVVVVGTEFTVAWQPDDATLDVWVDEGIVRVEGDGLGGHGVEVSAGQHLTADARSGRVALQPMIPADPVRATAAPDRIAGPGTILPPAPAARDREPLANRTVVDSRGLAAEARAVSAVALDEADLPAGTVGQLAFRAEPQQDLPADPFPPVVHEPTPPPEPPSATDALWQRADAARLGGDTDVAILTLGQFRERHGDDERARTAAYLLGRMAQEVQSDPAASADWYQTYLNESPDGPLAEEALGRLILAHDAAGHPDLAREAARAYLVRFPDGPLAELAGTIGGP